MAHARLEVLDLEVHVVFLWVWVGQPLVVTVRPSVTIKVYEGLVLV